MCQRPLVPAWANGENTMRMNALLIGLLGSIAFGTVGCSLNIDHIFAMKDGSGADVALVANNGNERSMGHMSMLGGTVMRITTSASLLDYLDGVVDGDVSILDLLFSIPDMSFLGVPVGLVCVVLDDPPGG